MSKRKLLIGTAVVLLIAAGVVALLNSPFGSNNTATTPITYGAEVGNLAPLFSLTTFDGKDISLSDFYGKPIIVKFWASWCGACNATAPALTDFYDNHRDEVTIIAINIDTSETQADIDNYIGKYNITYLTGRDTTGKIVQDYRVTKTSTYFFLNAEGMITQKHSLVILDHSLFELGFQRALESI